MVNYDILTFLYNRLKEGDTNYYSVSEIYKKANLNLSRRCIQMAVRSDAVWGYLQCNAGEVTAGWVHGKKIPYKYRVAKSSVNRIKNLLKERAKFLSRVSQRSQGICAQDNTAALKN